MEVTYQAPKILYAVMRLSTNIIFTDLNGKERSEKIQGIAGFIPCYEKLEDAEAASCEGKFQIVLIKEGSDE